MQLWGDHLLTLFTFQPPWATWVRPLQHKTESEPLAELLPESKARLQWTAVYQRPISSWCVGKICRDRINHKIFWIRNHIFRKF